MATSTTKATVKATNGSMNHKTGGSSFPLQKLTLAEKEKNYGSVEEWGKMMIDSIIKTSELQMNLRYYNKKINYDLSVGKFHVEDVEDVVSPFGINEYQFPAQMSHYDRITPKLNLLKGEEIKRPFNWKVTSTGNNSFSEHEKERKRLILGHIKNRVLMKLKEQGMDIESEEAQMKSLEAIEEYMTMDYKDMRAVLGHNILEYLIRDQRLIQKFNKSWMDNLSMDEEVFWTGIINGEPICRVVNPLYFDYEITDEMEFIDQSGWAIEWRYISASQVHDEYHSVLTDSQVEQIEGLKGIDAQRNIGYIRGRVPTTYMDSGRDARSDNFFNIAGNTIVKVVRAEWKGLVKKGFLTFFEEDGTVKEIMVDETYKPDKDKGEEVEWVWLDEVWETTQIGNDITVLVRPKPNQYRSMDNPSKCRLGYTGMSGPYSMIESMKSHQYLYNIIMWRLKLAIARAKGRGMIFDLAMLPRSSNITIERLIYYLDVVGIAFVNSLETDKKGNKASLNLFKEYDLTISNTMQQYILMLDKLDQIMGDVSGVPKQREGQIEQRELVGNTERVVVQSSHITEPRFEMHNQIKQRVMTNLLEDAKLAWMGGKKAQYVTKDLRTIFFSVEPKMFLDSEYGVFVSNSAKDQKILETARQLSEMMLQQNKIDPSVILSLLSSDSIEQGEQKLKQAEIDAREREQKTLQQQEEATIERMQIEIDFKNRELDIKEQSNIRDNTTQLAVAEAREGDGSALEQQKVDIRRKEVDEGIRLKDKKIDQDRELKQEKK